MYICLYISAPAVPVLGKIHEKTAASVGAHTRGVVGSAVAFVVPK